MALPITVPYTFANATTTQNLSYLDADFNALANGLNGLANGTSQISISSISANGTPSNSTYLRGDGNWYPVSGSGTVTVVAATTSNGFSFSGSPITNSGTLTLNVPNPGTFGNLLTSNGSAWISLANSGSGIGTGQTWQSPSRSFGVTYTNTTGKPIFLIVSGYAYSGSIVVTIDGTGLVGSAGLSGQTTSDWFGIVQSGSSYSVTWPGLFGHWNELR